MESLTDVVNCYLQFFGAPSAMLAAMSTAQTTTLSHAPSFDAPADGFALREKTPEASIGSAPFSVCQNTSA